MTTPNYNSANGSPRPRVANSRRAFTLIELLAVMAIIIMLIGLGSLAFGALTGRRSTSMAQNQIAAMLGQMRAAAMNDASPNPNLHGVFFHYDPTLDRTVMQPVIVAETGDPDPNHQYKGWIATQNNTYQVGDRVVAMTSVRSGATNIEPKPMALLFRCINPVDATAATFPPETVNFDTNNIGNTYWVVDFEALTADVSEVPAEQLPVGIGVQLLTDVTSAPGLGAYGPERYLQTGMVLFDRTGKVAFYRYYPTRSSAIQRRVDARSTISGLFIYSHLGINIFDRERFVAATTTDSGLGFTSSDADYAYQVYGWARPQATDERGEEQWLDEQGKLLIVDRVSGELTEVRK